MMFIGLGACGHSGSSSSKNENGEQGGIAFHVGEAAHAVAKETGKAAVAAGKEIGKGAKEAQRGWVNSARKDKEKEK